MFVTAIDVIFTKRSFSLRLNIIDLCLIVFYIYYTVRAVTTPYMPLLHNQRFINWTLCVVLYFMMKRIAKIWPFGNHSLSFSSHSLSFNSHPLSNDVKPMITNDNRRLKKERSSNHSAANQNSFILSFLILMLVSFPFYSLPTLLLFFILLALGTANLQSANLNAITPGGLKIFKYASATLFIIALPFFGRHVYKQYKGYYYWDEADLQYMNGNYKHACKSFEKVISEMKYNGYFLQYYGKALAMQQNFPEGRKMLKHAQYYTSDEVLYTSLGDCYRALNQYRPAEISYQYAAFMAPNKLYPHYLLAKLYAQCGSMEKAVEKAGEVLKMKAKTENMAVDEIKQEMEEIIQKI